MYKACKQQFDDCSIFLPEKTQKECLKLDLIM